MSVDGAMISLLRKQWVEVRTLDIGEPVEKHGPCGEAEVHVEQLSYFSRLAVCNDRWSQMWRKALTCRLHRSALAPASQEARLRRAPASGNTSCSSVALATAVPASLRPGIRLASRQRSPSAPLQIRQTSPETEKRTTEVPVCRVCGKPIVRVRGHRLVVACERFGGGERLIRRDTPHDRGGPLRIRSRNASKERA